MSDHKILRQLRRGDLKTFETLFHRYYSGLLFYSTGIVKKKEVAEEIVLDVFYNIWKNRNEFRLSGNWKSYLYKAVYNNSLMELRKFKPEVKLDEVKSISLNRIATDPSQELLKNEMQGILMKTLNSLPERTKEIFSLSRFEGLKYREIATQLTISVKTVEANMTKALRAFRISLKENGY